MSTVDTKVQISLHLGDVLMANVQDSDATMDFLGKAVVSFMHSDSWPKADAPFVDTKTLSRKIRRLIISTLSKSDPKFSTYVSVSTEWGYTASLVPMVEIEVDFDTLVKQEEQMIPILSPHFMSLAH